MSAQNTDKDTLAKVSPDEASTLDAQQAPKADAATRQKFVLSVRPVQSQPTPRGVLAE
jgi:hypothetical protein